MYESLSDELSLIYTVGYRIEMEYVCILKRHVNEGIKVAEGKKSAKTHFKIGVVVFILKLGYLAYSGILMGRIK